jgi:hypothetical protein
MPMPDQNRAALRERLGMLLLGLAIGCVLVGLILTVKAQMAGRHAAQQPAGPSK